MKIRNIPYGYAYIDGCVAVHPEESVIVREVFNNYLAGKSLLTIAEDLNKRMVEYMVGVCGWNKARLKRLIEDERYLGKSIFPNIIEEEIYAESQRIKETKNSQKHINRQADIFQIHVPVKCPKCNGKLRRRYDSKYAEKERWNCQNESCQATVIKEDKGLIEDIIALMNYAIENPESVEDTEISEFETDNQFSQLDNEISLLLGGGYPSKSDLQNKILEYASLKYKACQCKSTKTQRLRDLLASSTPSQEFPVELFNMTVKEVQFCEDNSIELILINDKKLKKEKINGKENYIAPEGSSGDSPNN